MAQQVLYSLRVVLIAGVVLQTHPASAEVNFFSDIAAFSKWDARDHGTPATVTWSFVNDGTLVADDHPDVAQFDPLKEGNKISAMRTAFDANHGAGAFNTAIQNAFDTWQSLADITFVHVETDSGLPVGHSGPPQIDIRIAAYAPVADTFFAGAGAFGYGPPGDDEFFPNAYPVAGDILLNLAQPFVLKPGAEGEAVDPTGNDLEGLLLHELGHAAIGLGHPAAGPGDVMYIGAGCCDFINRIPSQEEIGAARWVYGPSDFNGDNVVDAADYTVWRDRKHQAISALDPGDPGFISFVEGNYNRVYQRWRADYGMDLSGSPLASETTPEPGALWLLAVAAGWTTKSSRRSSRS